MKPPGVDSEGVGIAGEGDAGGDEGVLKNSVNPPAPELEKGVGGAAGLGSDEMDGDLNISVNLPGGADKGETGTSAPGVDCANGDGDLNISVIPAGLDSAEIGATGAFFSSGTGAPTNSIR